jgi:hypothetical protein
MPAAASAAIYPGLSITEPKSSSCAVAGMWRFAAPFPLIGFMALLACAECLSG